MILFNKISTANLFLRNPNWLNLTKYSYLDIRKTFDSFPNNELLVKLRASLESLPGYGIYYKPTAIISRDSAR